MKWVSGLIIGLLLAFVSTGFFFSPPFKAGRKVGDRLRESAGNVERASRIRSMWTKIKRNCPARERSSAKVPASGRGHHRRQRQCPHQHYHQGKVCPGATLAAFKINVDSTMVS